MSIRDVFLLALLQGVTEFLPISSSGHLVMVQHFLGLNHVPVLFDLVLHLGTVGATVIVYYKIIGYIIKDLFLYCTKSRGVRKNILERGNVKLASFIFVSTVVTGIIGFIFKDRIGNFFYKPDLIPLFFLITGILLFGTKYTPMKNREIHDVGLLYPIVIGFTQAVAMFPGISRSGSTISAGLYLGMTRGFSGMYSFLLSIPSIMGAWFIELLQTRGSLSDQWFSTVSASGHVSLSYPGLNIIGFFVSFITGYGALRLLLSFLRRGKIHEFSYYCFIAAAGGFMINTII